MVYYLLRGLGRLLSSLPRSWALSLGRLMGTALYWLLPYRQSVAAANLARAFPDRTTYERTAILQACYRHFGMVLMDFVRIPYISDLTRIMTIEDTPIKSLPAGNQGAVIMSGHLGNWELVIMALGRTGYPFVPVVVRQQGGGGMYVDWVRGTTGCHWLVKKDSPRAMLSQIRAGSLLGVMGDQDARSSGIWVQLFQRPSSRPRGGAVFALKTGSPLFMALCVMLPDRTYRLALAPIDRENLPNNVQAATQILTQRYTTALEAAIRERPEQYFWFHRMWKTALPEAPAREPDPASP